MLAISRSELEREPDGLSKEMTDCRMSSGHWMCQTVGGMEQAPPNQTPPAPREEASQKPMYQDLCTTSSQQCDGRDVRIHRSMPKLLSAEHSALFDVTGIQCWEGRRAALMGPSRPRLAGIPMHVCHSFPCSCLRSFLGTFVQCWIACSSDWMHSCLSGGSSMHCLTPSNTQPRSSFRVS